MNHEISNFLDNSTVEVQPIPYTKWVCIGQNAGGLKFQHTMTVSQARQMAAALTACADALDAPIDAEFAAHRAVLEVVA